MARPIGFSTEDPGLLRSCLRDLLALSAMPEILGGERPQQMARSFADVVQTTLRPDLVYVRLTSPNPGIAVEAASTASEGFVPPERIGQALDPWLGRDVADEDIPHPLDSRRVRLTVVPVGYLREHGIVAALFARPTYNHEVDRLLLGVAANQCASALRSCRLMTALEQALLLKDELLAREEAARAQAESSRAEMMRILERITDGFAALDTGWKLTYINHQADRLLQKFKYRRESLLGKVLWEEFPDLVGSVYWEHYQRAIREQTPVQFESYDPRYDVWLEVHAYPSSEGLSVYFSDISERKHAEAALSSLASIVESSNDAIVGKTLDGIITSWNAGATHLYGYRPEEVLGNPFSLLMAPERAEDVAVILSDIAHGRHIEQYEAVGVRKDGARIHVSLSLSPIVDGAGRISGASSISRDITERKQIEEQRKELLKREQDARAAAEQANRAKDDFLAMVSHELRTPLNAMLGWSRLLRSGKLDVAGTARAIEVIERNALTQSQLIEDLLDVSRIVSGKLRLEVAPVEMAAVVEEAVDSIRLAAEAKGMRIQTILDPIAGPVRGDPNRLRQVVWNLLSNAVKFTPREGLIQVVLEQTDSRIQIRVSDSGSGITPELLPHVFDRFKQGEMPGVRQSGLGLGLAIVKHVVELHGGEVSAANNEHDGGATFTVSLPVMLGRSDGVNSGPGLPLDLDGSQSLPGVRVLAIDDDEAARDLLAAILRQTGAEVRTAPAAPQAVEILKTWRPDVLVSDIDMPGEDGYALIAKIRALSPAEGGQVPAAALTAYARVEDRLKALAAGYQMHMPKPVEPAELIAVVTTLARGIVRKP